MVSEDEESEDSELDKWHSDTCLMFEKFPRTYWLTDRTGPRFGGCWLCVWHHCFFRRSWQWRRSSEVPFHREEPVRCVQNIGGTGHGWSAKKTSWLWLRSRGCCRFCWRPGTEWTWLDSDSDPFSPILNCNWIILTGLGDWTKTKSYCIDQIDQSDLSVYQILNSTRPNSTQPTQLVFVCQNH